MEAREPQDEAKAASDLERSTNPLAIFRVHGDEPQMGRQLGELTRELGDFEAAVAFYDRLPRHVLGAGRRDAGRLRVVGLLERALALGSMRLDASRPAHLRERSRNFVAALGLPERTRRSLVGLDAAQNAIGLLARLGLTRDYGGARSGAAGRAVMALRDEGLDLGSLAWPGACSSFAVWGPSSEDGRLLHARNFDLPGIGVWDKRPTVTFCTPKRGLRYGFVSTRGADAPGVTAFNEAGLTLTAHTRFHRRVSFGGLGIVDLGHLIIREARTIAEAMAIASAHPIASSWGLIVGSARERRSAAIEVHAGRVALELPRPGATWFAATNRNQVPVMQPGEVAPSAAWVRYSDGRLQAMRRYLEAHLGLSVGEAMALLSSHEAGDVPGWTRATGDCLAQTISVQSVVFDPERERLWVSTGDAPTSRGPWLEVPWRWDDRGPSVTTRTVGHREARELGAPEGEAIAARDFREGVGGEAYEHFLRAAMGEARREPEAEVLARLEAALRLRPEDPSYRHLAGGVALRMGDFGAAADHLGAALETERSAFRRGQILVWAVRAAEGAGRTAAARAWRREREAGLGPGLETKRGLLGGELERSLPRGWHRELSVDFQLLTLSR